MEICFQRNRKRKNVESYYVIQKQWKDLSYEDYFRQFVMIFDDPVMIDFLQFDKCFLLADKYLIAICFIYLYKSKRPVEEYNTITFFAALSIAHTVEEDFEHLKKGIIPWIPGEDLAQKTRLMKDTVLSLWKDLDMRCLVSVSVCDEVMKMNPHHPIWMREREHVHGKMKRDKYFYNEKCSKCEFDDYYYLRYNLYTLCLTYESDEDSSGPSPVVNSDGDVDVAYSR